MTGWEHGPDFDGGHDHVPELPEEPYGLLGEHDPGPVEDAVPADPEPGGPGHVELPDEPAGLPPEVSVDWSADPDPATGVTDAATDWAPDDGTDSAGWAADDGTDPSSWAAAGEPEAFPPTLDMDVTPADGGPWTDPDLLGGSEESSAWTPPTDGPVALRPDLALADGDPDATWSSLRSSDDPAVRALALRWTA